MRILITGAGGFIGRALIKAWLAKGEADGRAIGEVIAADIHERALAGLPGDGRVRKLTGNICDPAFRSVLFAEPLDSVMHLAATLTADAETHFDRGLAINLHSALDLLQLARAQGNCPRFIFPSSIAAFGGPLPEVVNDSVVHTPQTSYGTAKAVMELLIDDFSRHGFVDGRTLRLPFVLIRPAAANPVVSDRVAAVVREPLQGRDAVCPLAPETQIPIASVQTVARSLIILHDAPTSQLGHTRAMNLPSLTVSIAQMVDDLARFDYPGPRGTVSWQKDERIQAIVESWPRVFVSEQATRLGIKADDSFADILRAYADELRAGSA